MKSHSRNWRIRNENARNIFGELQPCLTLEEAGAMVGISDHTAMIAEQAAAKKLQDFFSRLGVSSLCQFLSIEEEVLDAVAADVSLDDTSRDASASWQRLTGIKSLNNGCEDMRSAVVCHTMLRLCQPKKVHVPLLWRGSKDVAYKPCGVVDAMCMHGDVGLFRSAELRKRVGSKSVANLMATVITESEHGEDEAGRFELPMVVAVAAQIAEA
jgi:hypothetical protein